MAIIGGNADLKETYDGVLAGIAWVPANSVNVGDFVIWDSSLAGGNGAARRPRTTSEANADTDMGTYLGVSRQMSPVESLGDQLNNIDIRKQGVVRCLATNGETYTMFQTVYFNATQAASDGIFNRISNSTDSGARTHPAGVVILPQEAVMQGITILPSSGTAALTTEVDIAVLPLYPATCY